MPPKKPAPSRVSDAPDEPERTFEESIRQLEEIVDAMESEDMPLEDLVNAYDKGTQLLRGCDGILKAARERINVIMAGKQDEIGLESEPAKAQAPRSYPAAAAPDAIDDEPDDEIRLF